MYIYGRSELKHFLGWKNCHIYLQLYVHVCMRMWKWEGERAKLINLNHSCVSKSHQNNSINHFGCIYGFRLFFLSFSSHIFCILLCLMHLHMNGLVQYILHQYTQYQRKNYFNFSAKMKIQPFKILFNKQAFLSKLFAKFDLRIKFKFWKLPTCIPNYRLSISSAFDWD